MLRRIDYGSLYQVCGEVLQSRDPISINREGIISLSERYPIGRVEFSPNYDIIIELVELPDFSNLYEDISSGRRIFYQNPEHTGVKIVCNERDLALWDNRDIISETFDELAKRLDQEFPETEIIYATGLPRR